MADVTLTVDGKPVRAPAGTLLIEACKSAGIEVPSFCYYPGLSLQGACRMCLVEIAKMAKLQTACTVPVTEGMVVTTQSETVRQARKAMLEFVLQNHPLDCPVCDAGGQCELQDATLTYGASESKLIDFKNHRDEQEWSPVVYFDRPRCIMCYRCVRVCGEGMDVWALGIANRNSAQLIMPNKQEHLECEECGMCIDVCPVGALTSGAYRYKTRPWEMKHVGTICTHCADGCTTTLGVRPSPTGARIIRGSNRDKTGINGDFLCIKGRYAFDFIDHSDRLKQPLIRREGKLQPASWNETLSLVADRFRDVRDKHGGTAIGVIGSTRTTNEEDYFLQKIARVVFRTNNIDHHRTADFPSFLRALWQSAPDATASMAEVFDAPAILLIGNDPTYQHPLLAWQIRNNVRLHGTRLYLINPREIKLVRQASQFVQIAPGAEGGAIALLAGHSSTELGGNQVNEQLAALGRRLREEKDLIIVFGSELRGHDIEILVKFGAAISGCKFVCLADYANSRGAADMGLYPDLLPGYKPLGDSSQFERIWGAPVPIDQGLNLLQMMENVSRGKLRALYVVGSNPVRRYIPEVHFSPHTFLVVQDLFLTETAALADVVLPAACAYEKSGTFTNTCGDIQFIKKAGDVAGPKGDLEIMAHLAHKLGYDLRKLSTRGEWLRADLGQSRGVQSGEADRQAVWLREQGLEPQLGGFNPRAILDEIQELFPNYRLGHASLASAETKSGENFRAHAADGMILPSNDDLFSSGTLGRYSRVLGEVLEHDLQLPYEQD
jgi:NADH-quinone oxidoreductase chain G